MSDLLEQIKALVASGQLVYSQHAFDRLEENGILSRECAVALLGAAKLEEYPDWHEGPSLLVLIADRDGKAVHAVVGLRKGTTTPAVVITIYRPDPDLWT
jgi:hypothetical protein